jgi:type I restriction enzyme S subunit
VEWRPLKRFCSARAEYGLNINSDNYVDEGIRLIRTTDITERGELSVADAAVYVTPANAAKLMLRRGDLLFSRSGTLGRCLRFTGPSEDATFAAYLVRFRVTKVSEARYVAFCSQAKFFVERIEAEATQSTISNFNAERYALLRLPWHPMEIQTKIADYLDAETARIDALIAKKQRMVELLEERRRVLFNAALKMRGFSFPQNLDEHIDRKQLPSNWLMMKLSQTLIQLTNGFVGPTRDILVDDGVRYVQSLHIKGGAIDFNRRPFYVRQEWHAERQRIHLRKGDVLIVQTGDIGQVAVVPPDFGEASCHALQIARVRAEVISGDFLGAYLRSPFGYQSLLSRATGALHPHLEGGIRDIPVIVPPLDVQNQILDEIVIASKSSDEMRSRLVQQVNLLHERRQALITAAVTGQLNIPGVAA